MFKKIKEFFKKIFKIDKIQYIEAPKEVIEPVSNTDIQKEDSSFKNQIMIDNEEEKRSLKLQKDFKEGKIQEANLSDEDFVLLANLYLKQIKEVKQSIQRYKERIISIKSKLKQNI